MAVGKSVTAASKCAGIWGNPVGLFAKVARLSVGVIIPNDTEIIDAVRTQDEPDRVRSSWPRKHNRVPRHYQMPYPTEISWSRRFNVTKPWASSRHRDVLVSFVGQTTHGDVAVRRKIGRLCAGKAEGLRCIPFRPGAAFKLKSRTVFCLEPVGDVVNRKSVVDSIVSGCVPVFFGIAQVFQYPVQWREWHSSAYVAINRTRFILNELDLLQTLRRIPVSDVRRMQERIAEFGGRFQFSMDDDPDVEDAVLVILRQLWSDAVQQL